MIDLTPLDVRKKRGDIAKVLRGYDPEEVDTFLEIVAERLEELVKENMTFKERSERLAEQVRSLETREDAVHEALVTAQELSGEINEQARRESLLVRREAETEAGRIRHAAEEYAERVLREAERLMEERKAALRELDRTRERFLRGFRTLLERELDGVAVAEEATPVSPRDLELDLTDWRETLAEIKARAPEPTRSTEPVQAPGPDSSPAAPEEEAVEPEHEDLLTSSALEGELSMWASPPGDEGPGTSDETDAAHEAALEDEGHLGEEAESRPDAEPPEPASPPSRETVLSGRLGPDRPAAPGEEPTPPVSGAEVDPVDADRVEDDQVEDDRAEADQVEADRAEGDQVDGDPVDPDPGQADDASSIGEGFEGGASDDEAADGGGPGPQPWDPEYEVPYPDPSRTGGEEGPSDQELPPTPEAAEEDDTLWLKGLMDDGEEDRSGP